jgi:hypothetical protein
MNLPSFLDLYLEFDDSGQLSTKIYDKRDDFNFKIINFPNMCGKIYQLLLHMVFTSRNWFTNMSIKINRLEEGHNSYPLVCRRPVDTMSLQRRQICYRWGTPAYWSLVPRSSMFYLFEFCLKNMWNLFLYSYESEFLQKLVKDKKIHEARAFNFTYRYIDDVLSINNSRFAEFLPLI